MKRLKKANLEDAQILLNRIAEASDNLRDTYYALFDNLNALFESYPDLYKQIDMVIKFPENKDASDIVKMNNDLKDMLEHFKDEKYLKEYVKE